MEEKPGEAIMPDTAQLAQDNDFLAAKPADQIAYLSHIDPDFAKASPADQEAYRAFVHGNAVKARNAEPTQFEKENPIPAPQEREAGEFLIGTASGASGLPETMHPIRDALNAPPPSIRETLTDPETYLGPAYGIARSLYGAGKEIFAPSGQGEDAAMLRAHGVGRAVGMVAPMAIGEGVDKAPEEISGGIRKSAGAMGENLRTPKGALKPGIRTTSRIIGAGLGHLSGLPGMEAVGALTAPSLVDMFVPERAPVPKAVAPAVRSPFEGATSSSIRNTPFAGEQTLPPAPKEAPPAMPRVRTRAEIQSEQEAGKPIAIYPEPRPESPGARPGAMYSVPRTELPGAARRGIPGAADVLRNLGEPVLFEPRGEISAPRSRIIFNAQGAPIEAGARDAMPQGNPTPLGKSIIEIGAPALRREVQEFVTPSKAMMTPEWLAQENSYELQKARDILRNLSATDEERTVAEARLRESE
jgi:hypothetical protein